MAEIIPRRRNSVKLFMGHYTSYSGQAFLVQAGFPTGNRSRGSRGCRGISRNLLSRGANAKQRCMIRVIRRPRQPVELVMVFRLTAYLLFAALFFSHAVFAQRPAPNPGGANRGGVSASPLGGGDPTIDLDISVGGADGGPLEETAMVTLVAPTGQIYGQGATQ